MVQSNAEVGTRNGWTLGVPRSAFALPRLGAFSQPDLPIHRRQTQRSSARANRPAQAPRPETAGHCQWIVGLDVAVHGGGLHFGVELGGLRESDARRVRAVL